MTRTLRDITDQEYLDLYRNDWHLPNHVDSRERGRAVLAREKAVVDAAKRLGCDTLLDVGCLDGYLGVEACRQGMTVSLLDLDQEILRRARDTLARHGFTYCHTFECLVEHLPEMLVKWKCPSMQWDAVTCTEVIEHVRDPGAVVEVLRQVARKAVILTTPVGRDYDDPLHIWHWEEEAALWEMLPLHKFREVSIERISSDGDTGHVFFVVARV